MPHAPAKPVRIRHKKPPPRMVVAVGAHTGRTQRNRCSKPVGARESVRRPSPSHHALETGRHRAYGNKTAGQMGWFIEDAGMHKASRRPSSEAAGAWKVLGDAPTRVRYTASAQPRATSPALYEGLLPHMPRHPTARRPHARTDHGIAGKLSRHPTPKSLSPW